VPDGADEIDHDDVEAAAADLGAEKVGAVRVQRQRDRRLADPPPARLAAAEQVVGFELAHDHRDGLGREPGHPRELGFGQAAVTPHEREDEPLVLRPDARLVGPSHEDRRVLAPVGRRIHVVPV
jgi:hypothetical protein